MLGYTNDQQTSTVMPPHDTWRSIVLTNVGTSMLNSVMRCIPRYKLTKVYKNGTLTLPRSKISSSCVLNYKHMTHAISMLNYKFSPCILKQKTIIPSIPMCYAKCHNVNICSLLKNHLC